MVLGTTFQFLCYYQVLNTLNSLHAKLCFEMLTMYFQKKTKGLHWTQIFRAYASVPTIIGQVIYCTYNNNKQKMLATILFEWREVIHIVITSSALP